MLISAFFQFLRVNQVSLQRLWMDATTSPGPARVTPEARPLILNDDGDSVSCLISLSHIGLVINPYVHGLLLRL